MANTDVLQVVALALFHPIRKRYLIVRRNSQQSGAGHWEFPGGKIEPNETKTQALVREIVEELGFTTNESELKYIHSNQYKYPQRMVEIHLFRYEKAIDEFLLVDHDQHAWVDENEITTFDLAPSNIPFIKFLY